MKKLFSRLSRREKLVTGAIITLILVIAGQFAFADSGLIAGDYGNNPPPGVTADTNQDAGGAGRPPPAPKPTTTSRGPLRFCKEGDRYFSAKSTSTATCKAEITCMVNPSDNLYHCANLAGEEVKPPDPRCHTEPEIWACGSQQAIEPTVTTKPTQQPSTTPPTVVPTSSPNPTAATIVPTVTVTALPTVTVNPTINPTVSPTVVPTVTTTPSTSPTATPTPTHDQVVLRGPERSAIGAARTAGLRIWVEADLAPACAAAATDGGAAFRTGLASLIAYAQEPGVIGVKFANDLGFRDLTSAGQIKTCLRSATSALRRAVPTKKLAISVVVPEFGCGSKASRNTTCVAALNAKYPLVTRAMVHSYLRAARVDRVDVATGLFSNTYAAYNVTVNGKLTAITPTFANRSVWANVTQLRWDSLVQIGARDYGLAYNVALTADQAALELTDRLGPSSGLGGRSVSLWGHNTAAGFHLLGGAYPGAKLWKKLAGHRAQLALVFDPQKSPAADIPAMAVGVSEIFILT